VLSRPIDIDAVFREGLLAFVGMVRSGRPPFPPEELGGAVALVEAVERSLTDGREAAFEPVEP
jgi:hypothetical protein